MAKSTIPRGGCHISGGAALNPRSFNPHSSVQSNELRFEISSDVLERNVDKSKESTLHFRRHLVKGLARRRGLIWSRVKVAEKQKGLNWRGNTGRKELD